MAHKDTYFNFGEDGIVIHIDGATQGRSGDEYPYTIVATDYNDPPLDVYYYIEWGDDQIEDWFGPYASGETATASHTWSEQGTYAIKAKAKNSDGVESEWAELSVSMPRNKATNTMPLFLRFFENHPYMFPILRQILLQRLGLQ